MMDWLAVWTKPRREELAEHNLRVQGYGTFYPHTIETIKTRTIRKPYLVRYIFAAITDVHHSVYQMSNTIGVSGVVHLGNTALTVPEPVISELMGRGDERGCITEGKRQPPPFPGQPGDQVKFAESSPLFGLVGELTRVDIGGRLTILLNRMLGAAREIAVQRTDVGMVIHKDGTITPYGSNAAAWRSEPWSRKSAALLKR